MEEEMVFSASKQDDWLPPKPPDDGGGGGNRWKVSFAEKVLGQNATCIRRKKVDLIAEKLFRIEYLDDQKMFVAAGADSTHGDWMVVEKKKSNRRTHMQGALKQDPKKASSSNPFSHLPLHVSGDLEKSRAVFSSGVSPKKDPPVRRKWVRKRTRNNDVKVHKQSSSQKTPVTNPIADVDPPLTDDMQNIQVVSIDEGTSGQDYVTKASILEKSATSKPTFKSAMNIEWVSGNKFRFLDEDENEHNTGTGKVHIDIQKDNPFQAKERNMHGVNEVHEPP
ncbi:hypothetical protein RIF29_22447 [Crotalaria pallida]|uniref:Uncharacterized protein n=1 Tax=Crotalaria pallida TaxID=3830 RepID=A0AAN9F986_CROPI